MTKKMTKEIFNASFTHKLYLRERINLLITGIVFVGLGFFGLFSKNVSKKEIFPVILLILIFVVSIYIIIKSIIDLIKLKKFDPSNYVICKAAIKSVKSSIWFFKKSSVELFIFDDKSTAVTIFNTSQIFLPNRTSMEIGYCKENNTAILLALYSKDGDVWFWK